MSFAKQIKNNSSRLIIIGLLITIVSTLGLAADWDGPSFFTQMGADDSAAKTGLNGKTGQSALVDDFLGKNFDQTDKFNFSREAAKNRPLFAPLAGVYNIPGDYPDLATAITDLNSQGVSGAVTLNLLSGNPQTAPAGGYVIGGAGSALLATTSVSNTVMIVGNNNIITASGALTIGALNDSIFKLIGADWITITGFTMQENPANTVTAAATNTMTEWGVALLYVSTTDGSQSNTIQNNTISLNRSYTNTFGIYSNVRHSPTSVTVTADITNNTTAPNSGNKVYGNNISNVNMGIAFIGSGTAANQDVGNDIGGNSMANGNTITNWGGAAAASGYVSNSGTSYCIFVNHQVGENVSFNTLTSAAVSGVSVTFVGIRKDYSATAPIGTFTTNINNNTITMTSGFTSGTFQHILSQGMTALSTATININNNTFSNSAMTGVASATTIVGALNSSAPGTLNMNGNTLSGVTSTATTGGLTGIQNSGAVVNTVNINNNNIGTAATGAATFSVVTTAQINTILNTGGAATATINLNGNTIRGFSFVSTGQITAVSNQAVSSATINLNNNQVGTAASNAYTFSAASAGGVVPIFNSNGASTGLLTITGNDIRGIVHSVVGTATHSYIVNQTFAGSTNISNNTFTNITANTTGGITFISNSVTHTAGSTQTVNNNSVVTGYSKPAAGGNVFFYNSFSTSGNTVSEVNTGNNFSNLTFGGTGTTTIIGFRSADGTTPGSKKTITNNTFSNIANNSSTGVTSSILYVGFSDNTIATNNVSGNTISNISGNGAVVGVFSDGQNQNFFNNTISGLSSTGSVAASTVIGMQFTGATTQNVFKNKIYDLTVNSTDGTVNGILASGGTTFNIYNNLIGDLKAPTATAALDSIRGINLTSTTTLSSSNVSFNTINLNAAAGGTNFGTTGIFHTASTTATTATLNLRNNIIVNNSVQNGTGLAVAFRRSGGAANNLNNYGAVSNYNDFYAGTPGASRLIYSDGVSSAQTMAAYKTGVFTAGTVAPRDAASFSENPTFLSTTGSSAAFLHINATIATQLESGGVNIAGITDDYDAETRAGNGGYGGTGTAPDIGADEFEGIPIDLNPPAISYTNLPNTGLTTNRILTVTITDQTAVASGANGPRIYFRKSTDANYVSTACMLTGGTAQNGTYDCTINYSLVGGGSVTTGEIIQYFVVAQDTLGFLGANPGGGFVGTDVNTVTTPPTTPASYTILNGFGGAGNPSKTVCAAASPNGPCDYTSLTNANGIFAAMNAGTLTGNFTINIADDLTGESGTNALNQQVEEGGGAGTFTVTIKAGGGVARGITGSNSAGLITLNGADRVNIDGTTNSPLTSESAPEAAGNNLTITNTNTGTSSAVIWVQTTAGGNAATGNTFKKLNIVGNSNITTLFGIGSGSSTISITSAGTANNNNRIEGCDISKTQYGIYSGGASAANKNTGTVITQNLINTVSPNNVQIGGILVRFEDGVQITQNNVANINPSGTTPAFGISLGLRNSNTFTDFSGSEVTGANISRNLIDNILRTGDGSSFGIGVASVTTVGASANTIVNNMVSRVRTTAATPSDFPAGILLGGGATSNTKAYFNSVSMTGVCSNSGPCYGIAVGGSNPVVDLRNNIFYNTQTSTTGKIYAIGLTSSTYTNLTSDYNDFFVSGANTFVGETGALGTSGTDRSDLLAWQTTTGKDANSKSVDPLFVSTSDLHLQPTSTLESMGISIAGITVDFDGDTRPATPDIGADEFSPPAPGTIQFSSATYSVTEGTPTVTLTVTRTGGSNGAVTANYALAGSGANPATGTAACGTPGEDFVNTGGSVMFADGDIADKTFNVTICNDTVYELNQTFDATLSIGAGTATLGTPNPATVTINNDDAAPTITINDVMQAEGNSGPTSFTPTISLNGASEVGGDFLVSSADNTATQPSDYIQYILSVNYPPLTGPTLTIPISSGTINGDTMVEPDETFFLNGSSCTNCTFANAQGVVTILNDDADYSVTTTGNAIVVTDNSGNSDSGSIIEPAAGQIKFSAIGRSFQINGATILNGDSGNLPLAGVTNITFNGQGGSDTVNVGAFTTALPSLTINGGTGDDSIFFQGNINFASNANLDLDLQNDDPTPGVDIVTLNPGALLTLSGSGTAIVKVSRSVMVNSGAQIAVANGNLTIEANQQATPTTSTINGVTVSGGLLTTSGTGNISIKGKGGAGALSGLRGVFITSNVAAITSTSAAAGAGTITINGTGGAGMGSNTGVNITSSLVSDSITSVRGDISITGQGGAGTTTLNLGVFIIVGKVRSTGPAKIDINGTGGSGTSSNSGVRIFNFGGEVTSAGGDITITGNGGTGNSGGSNHGISIAFGGIVSATGGAKITLNGNGGDGAGSSTGIGVALNDQVMTTSFSKVTSNSGDISLTGVGGTGPATGAGGGNIGVNINSGAGVLATGAANVIINGTGGACTDPSANDCYGVDFESANFAGTSVSTQSGNLTVAGTSMATTGLRQNGIRLEDSVGAQPFTITTGTGAVSLTATGGNSDPSSAAIEFADDTTMTLGGVLNTITADSININASQVSINAGANPLTIKPKTAGWPVDLGGGDSATMLGLTDSELDLIAAGTLNIGNNATGNITVSNDITRPSATVMNLFSGADINIQSGSLNSGGGNVTTDPASRLLAGKAGVDVTTGAGGIFKIASGRTLRLNVGAPVVDTGYDQLNVAGQVDVTNAVLSLQPTATPTGGEVYTLVNNDGTDPIIGTFAGLPEGATIPNILGSGFNGIITYVGGTGNDVVVTVQGAPSLQFSTATDSVSEGGGSITLTVTRTGATGSAVSVNYGTAGVTATGGVSCTTGVDFINASGTLNFASGDTSKSFNVTICDDSLFETNETFTASLNTPGGGAVIGTPSTETVTITENDTAPSLQFSSATYSNSDDLTARQSGGKNLTPEVATITVTRTGATGNAVSVNYATSNGTATGGASCTAGVDYITAGGTLSFAAGITSQSFNVTVCPDMVYEGDETVNLTLSGPSSPAVLGTPNTAVLTILDNDAPSVQFSASTYMEDESQTAVVTVTRTGDVSGTTTVNYATSNGTATGGASCTSNVDYVNASGTLTFNANVTSQTFNFLICGDQAPESPETVNLTLSSPSSPAVLGTPNMAVLTINDTASQYVNTAQIQMTDPTANPYPATISVVGGPTNVGGIKVTLYDLSFNFADNLDILLVGPGGQKIILMADSGGPLGLSSPATITFDDSAGAVLPDSGIITTGKYEPTTWEPGQANFPSPAPAGPYSEPGSTVGGPVTLASVFGGTNSNGNWNLYIRDDLGSFVSINGQVAGGWGLQILAPTAAGASISGRITDTNGAPLNKVQVMLVGGSITQPVIARTNPFGYYQFEGLPAGQTYVLTVLPTKRYSFPNPNRVITLEDSIGNIDFQGVEP